MAYPSQCLFCSLFRHFCLGLLLAWLPAAVQAQAPDYATASPRNTVFFSPAELFYKVQAGYEHSLSPGYSIGIQAAVYPGFRDLYKGWHTTLFGRHYLEQQGQFGFYTQAQVSVYEHEQLTSIIPIGTKYYSSDAISYRWSGLGGGAGIGIGYRLLVLRKTFQQRLSVDGMVGVRLNWRPQPQFDHTTYRVTRDFLPDGFEWFIISPGSILHGLLTAGYHF